MRCSPTTSAASRIASSRSGPVEALEGESEGYLVAVQWHPEALTESDARTRKIFADFIAAAAGRR
jgi:gamma-glutamyl-gamma-aminobutyrate hydrolase PuuD